MTGTSPLRLRQPEGAVNPVLRASDVSDVKADFVADPFLVREGGSWYMFFEVLNALTGQGDIALASSADGLRWSYRRVVLDEPFHLSYPFVFQWEGAYFMMPESAADGTIRLYQATAFPLSWELAGVLLRGNYADSTLLRRGGRWWLFTCSEPHRHNTLRLFTAGQLLGPWQEHPASPLVRDDASRARPAGRIIDLGDRLIRLAQNSGRTYGRAVRAFEITTLDASRYAEREIAESPLLSAGPEGWRLHGMHQLDALIEEDGRWLAAVDGYSKNFVVRIAY